MSARFGQSAQEDEYVSRHSTDLRGPVLEDEEYRGDSKWWYHWMRRMSVPEADELYDKLSKEANIGNRMHAANIATILLPNAISFAKCECIAVLMMFGASPYVRHRRYDRRSALELVTYLWNANDLRIAYFIGVLINVEKRALSPRLAGSFDVALGVDREGPLREIPPNSVNEAIVREYDTPLTFAISRKYVYCVKWLLYFLHVNANTPNGLTMTPLEVAMAKFPKSVKEASHVQKLERWRGIVEAILDYADADERRWRAEWPRKFPEAYPALQMILREKYGIEI